jgi:hypothetical protein
LEYLAAGDVRILDGEDSGRIQEQLAEAHDLSGLTSAREMYGFAGAGQTVVIVDSGVAYDHEALGGGFGVGYQVVGGWDFTNEDDADPYDDGTAGSHGTHVAGIVGSRDESFPGVAPGVDLVALRVFNDYGAGYFEWVEDALQWIHDNRNAFPNPITAVNLSLGAGWNDDSVPAWAVLEDEFSQLEDDGIFIGVAAGNSFLTYGEPGLSYPAASPYVVPVAAVNDDGQLSYFSQRNDRVIAAPGRDIMSTVPDYAGDDDGLADDFASYSGTSMAAPYVTGASVLLRQAYEFVGQIDVTQDQIYSVMQQTGDQVWDSETEQYYTRLNVQAALDYIMPDDDYGSTTASAYSLGNIGGSMGVSGMLDRLDDVDYFAFTAAGSGTVEFAFNSSEDANPVWIVGNGAEAVGDVDGQFRFDVVQGQQYVVGVRSDSGLAHYELDIALHGEAGGETIDWGVVAQQRLDGVSIADGDNWFQMTPTRDGVLTVEAMNYSGQGHLGLELYDSSDQPVPAAFTGSTTGRLDAVVVAGHTYYLRATGASGQADFRVSNLVNLADDAVTVLGTDGDDQFVYRAGSSVRIVVNNVAYQLDGLQHPAVWFHGGDGDDRIVLNGTEADETADFEAGHVRLSGGGFQVTADSVETVFAYGGGGLDQANFKGTIGDDQFIATPQWARMTGSGYYNHARGFGSAAADAAGGENDRVIFQDSEGNDRLVSDPASTSMDGDGYARTATGFDRMYAVASGGEDEAVLHDSEGDDLFVGKPDWARLQGEGFVHSARGFDRVYAHASNGEDRAVLYDSAGDDHLIARARSVQLDGHGFLLDTRGFGRVTAFAGGGHDTAHFYDTSGDDLFVHNGANSSQRGEGYINFGRSFEQVYAHAGSGGEDIAVLQQITADDYLYGRDDFAYLSTDQAQVWVYDVGRVLAYAADGEAPQSDVDAVDYLFARVGQWAR